MDDPTAERDAVAARYARRNTTEIQGRYRPGNTANILAVQQRERLTLAGLVRHGRAAIGGLRILDVGCGQGGELLRLLMWGADPALLAGIDLIPERVAAAKLRLPASDIRGGDAASLPWADGTFDLVVQHTAFSSMLAADTRKQAAAEVMRVIKAEGLVLWYDFVINPTNLDTHPIRPGELRGLFPGFAVDSRRLTLAPPISRAIAPLSWQLASVLQGLRPLQTHLLAFLTRPPT